MKRMLATLFLSIIICSFSFAQTSGNMFVTAYYPDWSIWTMKPWLVDYSAMTHIIHFSADPDASTPPYFSPITKASDSLKLQYGNGNNDRSINFQDSLIHYAHKNGVKALLCIGGIYGNSDANMDQICSDINKIRVFVSAISSYCKRKGYDGVDVDWEGPNNKTDYNNLLTVLRDTLNSWPTPGIITAAVYSFISNSYDVPVMAAKLDQITVMNYDQGTSTYAGFNSPLKPGECKASGGNWSAWTLADHGPQNWINAGFPKSKIGMGVPFYGWEFSGVDGPCQLRNGGQWYRSYSDALNYLAQYPNSYRWDDSSKVPYLSFTDGSGVKHMVSYDDSVSIAYKVNYAKSLGIGGLMIYELVGGWVQSNPAGKRDPLLQALKKAVGGTVTPPPPPPPVQPPAVPVLNTPADGTMDVPTGTTVSWGSVSAATGYRVQVSTSSTFGTTVVDQSGITGTSYAVNNLLNSTTYYWRVNASNSAGSGNWSNAWSFVTVAPPVPQPPSAPVLASPSNGATGVQLSTSLSWGSVSGAADYQVQVSTGSSFSSNLVDQSGIAGTSFTLGGLTNSTVYYWRVNARNSIGTSGWSAVRSFTTVASAPPPPPPDTTSGNMFVTAYYPDWSIWTMKPWLVDYSAMTHIIHFSADPDASTPPYFSPITKASDSLKLQYGNGNNDRSINFQDSLIHYAHKNGVKALLCIGGIYGNSDANMDQICSDINKIRVFVSAISSYCKRKGYDGVDVDWEGPNNKTDYNNLLTVLRDTLNSWPTPGIITAAVYSFISNSYDVPVMAAKLDQITVMNYDQGTSTYAGFNSPLKPGECKASGGNWSAWTLADHGPQNWINAGFPKSKIGMGVPFYGWEFSGVDGPCQLRNGGQWYRSYSDALNYLAQYPNSYRWDDSSKVPYLSFTDGSGVKHMVSYDDSVSIAYKVNYAKSLGIGGLMIYELVGGWVQSNPAGKRDPLLQALKKAVGGTVTPPPPPPPVQPPAVPVLNTPADGTMDVPTGTTVSWGSVSAATGYRVQVSTSSTFGTTVVDQSGITGTSYAVNNLLNSTTYYWRVNASNSAGSGNWSNAWSFTVVSSGQPPVPADTIPYPAVLRDDFNRPDGPLPGTNRWKTFDNYTGGIMSVVSSKLQATNGLTVNTMGGVVWDSMMTSGTEASVTLQQKSGNYSNASLLLYAKMNSKDFAAGSGYRLRFTEQSGNDLVEIHRVTNGYANGTVLASVNYEIRVGDVVTFRILADNKTMCVLVNGDIILSAMDTVHTAPSWYFAIRGYVSTTPVIFDDFRVSPNAAAVPLGLPVLNSPANQATNVPVNAILNWDAAIGAVTYRVQVSTDALFGNIVVDDSTVPTNSFQLADLNLNSLYYWRVNAKNLAGTSEFSEVRSFTTTSVSAAVVASPNNINFGKVGVGYSKKDSITISNPGSSTVTLSQIQSSLSQYEVAFTGTTIAPGASKKIYVTFTPNQRTTYDAKIAIVINSGNSTDTALVTGKGVRAANLRHRTIPVNFGVVQPEELKTDTITVYNDGELNLEINNITSTNSVFSISPQQAVVAPEDSQKFVVSAHPTVSQEENGYFLFEYSGSITPDSLALHIDQSTGVEEPPSTVPGTFALYQNYPNPFNPSTTIGFDLANPSVVYLKVYNALGQEVSVVYNGQQMSAGKIEVLFNAGGLPSGIYYYRFTAQRVDDQGSALALEPFVRVNKMMLVK